MTFNEFKKNFAKDLGDDVKKLCSRLPERIRWAPHNLIAHPLSELYYLVTGDHDGFGGWIHDCTIPEHEEGEGRG